MKQKTSLFLMITTIILCFGVMVTGVYSVLSASLNMNGTLGFNMHNATVTVQGSIQNVAQSTDNWQTASPITKTIERTIMGGEEQTTTNLDLQDLYFYTGTPMIFTFTFTNISQTAIQATFPLPTVGDGVMLLTGTANGYTEFDGVYSTRIAKDSSLTVKFALSMAHIETGTKIVFKWQGICFEESQGSGLFYTISDGTEYNNYLATKIGKYNDNDVEWVAFAVKGTGTNGATKPAFLENETVYSLPFDDDGDGSNEATWYSLSGVDMSNKDYVGYTFWFIQRDVTSQHIYDDSSYSYDGSDIHSYLNSTYISEIGFTNSEQLKSNEIVKRKVTHLFYPNNPGGIANIAGNEDLPFGEGSGSSCFWLMGMKECELLVCESLSPLTVYCDLFKASQDWWLRTFYGDGALCSGVCWMSTDGYVQSPNYDTNHINVSRGIRPAFMLKINEI